MDTHLSSGVTAGMMTNAAMSNNVRLGVELPSQSFVDGLMERLGNLSATLVDPDNDLSMLRDRMFGPPAETALDRTGTTGPGSISRAESVFDLIESIQRRASSVASLARGLNSRI